MMNAELSEYERQRLENIKQNQEILKQLNIKGIIPEELKKPPVKATAKPRERKRPSEAESAPAEPEVRRVSTRLQRKAAGMDSLDEDFFKVTADFAPISAPAPPKPKRIVGRIPFDPEEGASEGFLEVTGALDREIVGCTLKMENTPASINQLEIKNEHSVVKVMKERIYSVAIHPDPSKVIVAVGGKFGELAFLDATEAAHPKGLADRQLPEPEDFHPGCYLFKPHTGSISNLRYNPVNSAQLFSTSYDNIVRCMDLNKGSFDELYNFGEDTGDVITGFDFDVSGNVFYFSDTDGIFRWADRREKKEEIAELRLHEKKIGCVSACRDGKYLATASNDGSIGIWDLRKLMNLKGEAEALHTLTFRRSVTSAYFHPQDAGKLISTCYDDHVRIHYNMHLDPSQQRHAEISHNNQTGRWITNFKAVWDPKSHYAVVGNMNRGIDLIDGEAGEIARNVTSEFLTAQPAVNAFHPNLDLVASGNASGKISLWSYAS